MFNTVTFEVELTDLIRKGDRKKAEGLLLRAYSELKEARSTENLEYVVSRLAQLYSTPDAEDLGKAEGYFLESESILPSAYTKYQTAMFYFYVLEDYPKTIKKVDEIRTPLVAADRASYYSALTLKGQALIKLEMLNAASKLLEELLSLIRTNPSNLPYGDEINLLQAGISTPTLAPTCREILELIIPRIRSQEYVEKARALLK